jgi:hypothetical protein
MRNILWIAALVVLLAAPVAGQSLAETAAATGAKAGPKTVWTDHDLPKQTIDTKVLMVKGDATVATANQAPEMEWRARMMDASRRLESAEQRVDIDKQVLDELPGNFAALTAFVASSRDFKLLAKEFQVILDEGTARRWMEGK